MKDARKHPLYIKDCKCGCPLTYMKTPDGKTQVLDLRAPVFQVMGNSVIETTMAFVSHFATCKFASEFSHKEKAS